MGVVHKCVYDLKCAINKHVAAGKTRDAGDCIYCGPSVVITDTECAATLCAVNEYVASNVCTTCADGKTNAKDDDASGVATTCDTTLCAVNEYVASNVCTACAAGKTNAAGDDASKVDTECDAATAAKQIKVVVTVTLTGVTEEQVTAVFKKPLKSTIAAEAGAEPSQVTLTFVYTKAATRRLAAGDTVAVTDAAAATKVSADIVKLEPTAFIATLKKEL